jgi:hypothetical protein
MTVTYRCIGRSNYLKRPHRDKDIFAVDSNTFTKRLYVYFPWPSHQLLHWYQYSLNFYVRVPCTNSTDLERRDYSYVCMFVQTNVLISQTTWWVSVKYSITCAEGYVAIQVNLYSPGLIKQDFYHQLYITKHFVMRTEKQGCRVDVSHLHIHINVSTDAYKSKFKFTVKQALRAQRQSRVIALSFL